MQFYRSALVRKPHPKHIAHAQILYSNSKYSNAKKFCKQPWWEKGAKSSACLRPRRMFSCKDLENFVSKSNTALQLKFGNLCMLSYYRYTSCTCTCSLGYQFSGYMWIEVHVWVAQTTTYCANLVPRLF